MNVGNREVIINNWGFIINNEVQQIVLFGNSLSSVVSNKLPATVEIERKIGLSLEREEFVKFLQQGLSENKFSSNNKVSFYVSDSTEKLFKVKTGKRVKDYLGE